MTSLSRQNDTSMRRTPSVARGVVMSCIRALLALSVVLLLLAGTQAQSFALFRCAFTGVALTSCCCHGAEETPDAGAARLSRAGCCSVEQVDASLPTGAASPDPLAPPSQLLVVLLPALPIRSAAPITYALYAAGMRDYAGRTRAGPKTPLTIVHRRLLL